jgi:hypothetical protein
MAALGKIRLQNWTEWFATGSVPLYSYIQASNFDISILLVKTVKHFPRKAANLVSTITSQDLYGRHHNNGRDI